ncbi:MAG: response regulator [Deltaproteobacteria bacterium]|nr:response regulator [Deltaproteobacteria bacterium]MBW2064810.1 response regulator [Deltaproteobacteria bacterium]
MATGDRKDIRDNEAISSSREEGQGDYIKVLLVDDEVAYVNVISKRLGKRNFKVTKALSGSEAIQVLRREDFDVAVVDLKMEGMDGIEVLKVFKKMAPGMEVIMLTGHGSEKAAREGVAAGAFDYLTKPCDLEELMAKIRQAFQKSGGR